MATGQETRAGDTPPFTPQRAGRPEEGGAPPPTFTLAARYYPGWRAWASAPFAWTLLIIGRALKEAGIRRLSAKALRERPGHPPKT